MDAYRTVGYDIPVHTLELEERLEGLLLANVQIKVPSTYILCNLSTQTCFWFRAELTMHSELPPKLHPEGVNPVLES